MTRVAITYPTAERLGTRLKGDHGMPASRIATAYVIETSGCWRWIKSLSTVGYGKFWVNGAYHQAHVIVWIVSRGQPPVGLEADHLCRHRWCVNPDHIEWVTHRENVRRGAATRLTPDLIAEIRGKVAAGASQRKLAGVYGIDHSTISRALSGDRWGDVAERSAAA